jgi:hypothetical protein
MKDVRLVVLLSRYFTTHSYCCPATLPHIPTAVPLLYHTVLPLSLYFTTQSYCCPATLPHSPTAVPLLYNTVLPLSRYFTTQSYCCPATLPHSPTTTEAFLLSWTTFSINKYVSPHYQPSCQQFTTGLSFCIRQDFAAMLETGDNRWVTCSRHIVTVHIGCKLLNSVSCKHIFWTVRTTIVGISPFSVMFRLTYFEYRWLPLTILV